MVRKRRSIDTMFAGAVEAKKEDEVERLRLEVAQLKAQSATTFDLPISSIVALRLPENLKQPRRYFDPLKMAKLRDSIEKHGGVLEPILVRPAADDLYEIISGERRWRCCQELGIELIPAMVREMDDKTALEVALIAHLLSESISPIEETDSIMGLLMLRLQMPFEEVKSFLVAIKNFESRGIDNSGIIETNPELVGAAKAILEEFDLKVGSFVSNRLPLLELPGPILNAVREGQVSPTNARIVAQQPEDWQDPLLKEAQRLTKADLLARIEQIRADKRLSHTSSSNAGLINSSPHLEQATFTEFSEDEAAAEDLFSNGYAAVRSQSLLDLEIEAKPIHERVFERFKNIRRKRKYLNAKKIQTRLARVERELKEIEVIIASHENLM